MEPNIPIPHDREYTLQELLPLECILPDLPVPDYHKALHILVTHLHGLGHVHDAERCLQELLAREELAPTLLDCGVAVPHTRTSEVEHTISAVARFRPRADAAPVLIVLTLAPQADAITYLRYLKRVAEILVSTPEPVHDPAHFRELLLQ